MGLIFCIIQFNSCLFDVFNNQRCNTFQIIHNISDVRRLWSDPKVFESTATLRSTSPTTHNSFSEFGLNEIATKTKTMIFISSPAIQYPETIGSISNMTGENVKTFKYSGTVNNYQQTNVGKNFNIALQQQKDLFSNINTFCVTSEYIYLPALSFLIF